MTAPATKPAGLPVVPAQRGPRQRGTVAHAADWPTSWHARRGGAGAARAAAEPVAATAGIAVLAGAFTAGFYAGWVLAPAVLPAVLDLVI